jgi:hypothetical protein
MLLILALFGTIVGLGTAISGPAGVWAAKLPEGIPRLQERLSFMQQPIDMNSWVSSLEEVAKCGQSPNTVADDLGGCQHGH